MFKNIFYSSIPPLPVSCMIPRLDDWEAEKGLLTLQSCRRMELVRNGAFFRGDDVPSTPSYAACTCPHRRSQWSRMPSLEMSFRDQLQMKAVGSWTIG